MKEKEINKVADKDELVQVLDENGNETNKLEQRKVVHDNGIWHNEVSCIVINNNKQILLQRRSANKKQYPSCWGLFAGHVVGYDSLIDAIITEMREELISEIKEENLFLLVPRMKNQRENNNCFVTCYCAVVNKPESEILFQREEIDEVKWFEFDEFKILVENEKGTIFKNNDYYKAIIAQLEKLFNNKDFYKKIDDLTEKLEELDRFGNPTGKIITREFAHNYGIYHKAGGIACVTDLAWTFTARESRSDSLMKADGCWTSGRSPRLWNRVEIRSFPQLPQRSKRICASTGSLKMRSWALA